MADELGPLAPLVDALNDDPGIVGAIGKRSALLAVPEAARALSLASIAKQSGRATVVVCVPTTSEAERLRSDLALYLEAEAVVHFPTWETLPFERCLLYTSPSPRDQRGSRMPSSA